MATHSSCCAITPRLKSLTKTVFRMLKPIGANAIVTFLLVALVFMSGVDGNSLGAPTCIPNISAPGLAHKGSGYEERSMEDGLVTIKIGVEAVVVGKPVVLMVGEEYEVVISKATDFKGYMGRISGGDSNVDTKAVFTLNPGETLLKQNDNCDLTTGGLTHTNANGKRLISFNMTFDEPSMNMRWDVNIVETRVPVSRFYYNQYIIHALAPGQTIPPTPAPTSRPTMMPTVTETSTAHLYNSYMYTMIGMMVGLVAWVWM